MSRLERPFSTFVKQHRPLQATLDEYAQQIADRLRAVDSLADLASLEREVTETLASAQQPRFLLGGQRTASIRPGEWATKADGTKVTVTRHHVAVQVVGDILLSGTWPSNSEDLLPADDSSWPESELSTLDARDDVWAIGFHDEQREDVEWALYTYLDLTLEDEARIAAGEIDHSLIIEERISRIAPIVDRIDRDLVQSTLTLSDKLTAALSSRRQELTNRLAVSKTLRFPNEWVIEPIRLEKPPAPEEDVDHGGTLAPLPILQIPRLEPASFGRLQTTIRVWADAIERHPGGFRNLTEDQISDLLCATLNATLAGANREVFSRSGKTDIYVRADVLGEGRGPAKVFVAESKKATSKSVVRFAIQEQLFHYLTTSDISAVLLLLFPQQDFLGIRDSYLDTLRDIGGFVDQQPSTVEGWPTYRYEQDGRTLSVCIAMVHL